ncbi:hypothetical protein FRX31_025849 [Thalictrum thalictroides]|uniref:Uncharacterized protein n=1 Tax=Thalictrum thalictroides TaxID=46969 RepID=A0A7J6VJS9_THATH|nr:hypothetical protein FRX31_025849 [Thalictrum thalictroides]
MKYRNGSIERLDKKIMEEILQQDGFSDKEQEAMKVELESLFQANPNLNMGNPTLDTSVIKESMKTTQGSNMSPDRIRSKIQSGEDELVVRDCVTGMHDGVRSKEVDLETKPNVVAE